MLTVRLNSKKQIVLSREAREAMHLTGRDELLVVVEDEVTVIMQKPKSYREALSGIGKKFIRKPMPKRSAAPGSAAIDRWFFEQY